MRGRGILFSVAILFLAQSACAQQKNECGFGFEIETQSSAFQAMVVDGEQKHGLWFSIGRAPVEVRKIARYVGRLQVCLTTNDGKSRDVVIQGSNVTINSPFVANCTATLLSGNRLLTNHHCYHDPILSSAGFDVVLEARVNFNYLSRDDTGSVATFSVAPKEVAADKTTDAMVLEIIGGDANADLGGQFPMEMIAEVQPYQELRMIHHPGAEPQQYSTGLCQVHRRQEEIPNTSSVFRHTCESMGGSSGSLLLDARTLAVVALHNQGGLSTTGDSYNGGHKIAMVNDALNLGFSEMHTREPANGSSSGLLALTQALMLNDPVAKRTAVLAIIDMYPGTDVADSARTALSSLPSPPQITGEFPIKYSLPFPIHSTSNHREYNYEGLRIVERVAGRELIEEFQRRTNDGAIDIAYGKDFSTARVRTGYDHGNGIIFYYFVITSGQRVAFVEITAPRIDPPLSKREEKIVTDIACTSIIWGEGLPCAKKRN